MKLTYMSLLCALFCMGSVAAMGQSSHEFDLACPECQICQCDYCSRLRRLWECPQVPLSYNQRRPMRWTEGIAEFLATQKQRREKGKKRGSTVAVENKKGCEGEG